MAASGFEAVKTLVSKLLGLLETPGRSLYYGDENVRELKDRLKRLRSVITKFESVPGKSTHPIDEWLQGLHQELRVAEQLLLSIEDPYQLWQAAGQFREVNEKLSKVLGETPVVQSASSTSPHPVEEKRLKASFGGDVNDEEARETVNDVIEALADVRAVLPEERYSETNKHLLKISRQLESYLG